MNTFSQSFYRADIDGLRAIAVLSVVGFHAFPGLIHGGFIGVDVFFVISGFLISSILLRDLQENRFSFAHFFSRRIRRIFPSLILVLLACWIFGWLDLLPDEFIQLGKHIAGGAGFIDNFLYWQEIGYFDQSAEKKPLLHLWSIGVEEQFYLIYPLLLWIGFKKPWNMKMLYVFFILSFALNVYLSFTSPSSAFFLPFTRFWEFLLGSFVALYFSRNKVGQLEHNSPRSWFELIPIVGLALLTISFFALNSKSTFPGFWALLPTLGAALIIFSPQNSWINRNLLSNPMLVRIGLISYPLYLWHWPLLSFAHIMRDETPSIITRIIAISIAFVFAWASYKWLEYPIRFGKNQKNKTFFLILVMALVAVLGLGTLFGKGFPQRVPEKYRELQELFKRTDNASKECIDKFGGGGNSYCQIDDTNKAPTALLIGDSHAGHFYAGLNEYYKNKGGNLLNMGAGGCPPFDGIEFGKSLTNSLPLECHHYASAFKALFNNQSIKTVIFAFDHSAYLKNDYQMHFYGTGYAAGDNLSISTNAFKKTIEKITLANKKVVLIYDMPNITIDLKKCFAIRPFEIGNRNCNIDSEIWIKDFKDYELMIKELQKDQAIEIFMAKDFVGENFPINKEGLPMYSDKTHLSKLGSKYFLDFYNF